MKWAHKHFVQGDVVEAIVRYSYRGDRDDEEEKITSLYFGPAFGRPTCITLRDPYTHQETRSVPRFYIVELKDVIRNYGYEERETIKKNIELIEGL